MIKKITEETCTKISYEMENFKKHLTEKYHITTKELDDIIKSNKQKIHCKENCVMYNKTLDNCKGLNELVCSHDDCPFFKNKKYYYITHGGAVIRKEK